MIPSYPILEYDPSPKAILNPDNLPLTGEPLEHGVMCFFQEIISDLVEAGQAHPIRSLLSEIGSNPLYELTWQDRRLLLIHPGVGAPLAAGFLEEIIDLGVCKIIACGGCGVLNPDLAVGHPVIIASAVRDEGTSYHYLPPSREIAANPKAVRALEMVCQQHGIAYRLSKTWTTDGYYRETINRRALRLAEGCEIVEMEAAAFFAVAQFRGVDFGQVVYCGDLVIPAGWDYRGWNNRHSARSLLFTLAVEACLLL
jgi:purine-nucleoside phosphorylase